MEVPDTSRHPDSVVFDGRTFVLKKSKGGAGYYFANGKRADERVRPSLHRAIYESAHGTVPEGFEIHHVDDDQFNNDPSNLVAVPSGDHQREHMLRRLADPSNRIMNAANLAKAIEAAAEWHRSDEGRAWHREHATAQWTPEARAVRLVTARCEVCGETFECYQSSARICSPRCYQRRAATQRRYDVEQQCPICESTYTTNRHRPSATCSRRCGALLRHRR